MCTPVCSILLIRCLAILQSISASTFHWTDAFFPLLVTVKVVCVVQERGPLLTYMHFLMRPLYSTIYSLLLQLSLLWLMWEWSGTHSNGRLWWRTYLTCALILSYTYVIVPRTAGVLYVLRAGYWGEMHVVRVLSLPVACFGNARGARPFITRRVLSSPVACCVNARGARAVITRRVLSLPFACCGNAPGTHPVITRRVL